MEVVFYPPVLKQEGREPLYGEEQKVIVRGISEKALEDFAENQGYRKHERFKYLVIGK